MSSNNDKNQILISKPVDDKGLSDIYNFNIEAFSEADFNWTLSNLKKERKDGWKICSVKVEKQIIAAIFMKEEEGALHTKATPIKIDYQGKGYSHLIKEYFEEAAKKSKLKKIVNYCRRDNFRMISLNETHGYTRTGKLSDEDKNIIQWEKEIK